MKNLLAIFLITLTGLVCCAKEYNSNFVEQHEIKLDNTLQQKEYKLSKPTYKNNTKYNSVDDEDEMPINFLPTPLQLLKQYQQNNE